MAVDYKIIGRRIQIARKRAKITQQTLAEKLNVSVAFVSRIECGSSQVNLKRLTQICSILNISEGTILTGVCKTEQNYLSSEFSDILSKCSPEKQELIYKLSKLIAEDKD